MTKSRRQRNPRRTGNLFIIDAEAVSEARQFSSHSFGAGSLDDSTDSFICDKFGDLPLTSEQTKIRPSIMRKSSEDNRSSRKRGRVSFAASIETVHVVDSLKHCLTAVEKQELWETSPESSSDGNNSSSSLSPLESALFEAFCMDEGPAPSSLGRKDNKRRLRKTSSKLRKINNNYAAAMGLPSNEISKPNKMMRPIPSPRTPPLKSLTSRLGFRNRERMHSNILVSPLH